MDELNHYTPEDMKTESPQAKAPPCELENISQGGIVNGIFGALLGALLGAIPWFLASTFTNYFVGLLGALTGIAACYGYRLFHGRRSTGFAMAAVIISSTLAIFAAQLASWMYILCTDSNWQADAAQLGIPVALLALKSILMPENLSILAPDMIIGMFIGILGIVSVKQKVLLYTDPGHVEQSTANTPAVQIAQANAAASLVTPQSFTVQEKTSIKITLSCVSTVCIMFFCWLFAGVIGSSVSDPDDWTTIEILGFSGFAIVMVFGCIFLIFTIRRKIVVKGSEISYQPTFGKIRTFQVADISGIRLWATDLKLIGRDGRVLARFETNQMNSSILLQYLSEHGISLLVK